MAAEDLRRAGAYLLSKRKRELTWFFLGLAVGLMLCGGVIIGFL